MHRFFVPPSAVDGDKVVINGATAHQIRNVLRMRPGEHIVVLDNSGREYRVELVEVERRRVTGRVVAQRQARGEPRTRITLYQSMIRRQRFEFVLQKGTEVGVAEFVPVVSERCVINDLEAVNKKMTRWQRIILEAAEQSRRGLLPTLQPAMLFSQACERAQRTGGLSLLPWEEARENLRTVLQGLAETPSSVNLFIGPEGGFSSQEVELARGYGLIPVSLGPRILRAETAGIVTAAIILYELGDMALPEG